MTTMQQLGLFDERTISLRFDEYHRAHPEVFAELERLTQMALDSGRRRLGIRMLWERLRWELYVERGDEEYRMNDQFTSRYVRLLIERHPAWGDVFEVRKLRAI